MQREQRIIAMDAKAFSSLQKTMLLREIIEVYLFHIDWQLFPSTDQILFNAKRAKVYPNVR